MKTFLNKNNYVLVAVISILLFTAFFLVVKITELFIIAYIIALLGIVLMYFGFRYMINSPRAYPWFAAFPLRIWQYIVAQLVFSAVVILAENVFDWSLSLQWFIFIHVILLGICLITLVLLKAGKDIIIEREDVVKENVSALRLIQADINSILLKYPDYEKDLQQVAEALRYSDPMSHPFLAAFDEQIHRGILAMDNPAESDMIPDRCTELLKNIADRNMRVKMMK